MTLAVLPKRRPWTDEERRLACALGRCRYAPATFEKRFARDTSRLAADPDSLITPKQALQLRKQAHRYRKQLAEMDG